jgi:diaminohydroxyphosphoribosylaminopyrimidine deaminase / 5-amino-6-(5-phosphoribosylamino)uracil reductase
MSTTYPELEPILRPARREDAVFMELALRQARHAYGRTTPNPMVGSIIVRDGVVIGRGYHRCVGQDHGEVSALKDARTRGNDVRGATLYTNLEPCCHHARTPPCTEACINAGIARVVSGIVDPNPQVGGQGLFALFDAGIEVTVNVLPDACRQLNAPFITRFHHGRPHVTVKVAQSLDGRIATRSGSSFPLTGDAARRRVHVLRDRVDAILVGRRTVEIDNPRLTCRLPFALAGDNGPRDPVRIVLDPDLRTPLDATIFQLVDTGESLATTAVVVAEDLDIEPAKTAVLEALQVEVIRCPRDEKRGLDLAALLRTLAESDLSSVLVEGGSATITGFVEAGLVDAWIAHVAPVLIGGDGAPSPLAGLGAENLDDIQRLSGIHVRNLGPDVELAAPVLGDVYGLG